MSIKLFGSSIRNEDTPSSDIDLFVDFEDNSSLFDLIGFKNELEELLGKSVDVVTVKGVHPLMKEQIETEAVKI
ncbi:MAG: nucleotidyltransferase [Clostridia bacterium]|nr:nucleotidyltransferase [Clostridia bacterium]